MTGLDLVPIYMADRRALVDRLGTALEETLDTSVRLRRPWFDPEGAYDPSRGQYGSTTLLRQLLDDPDDSNDWVLGVTSVDLFAPVLTYVFGEAQLEGRAAVVSIHRLRTEAYGLSPDQPLLFERLLKEAVHEIGHLFGLVHCLNPACVMNASNYVEEIDSKPEFFCSVCLELVHDFHGKRG